MPTFQGKFSDTNYIVVADDLHEAISLIEAEGERRGDNGPLSMIKEVDARVIGISEPGPTQERMFPLKED